MKIRQKQIVSSKKPKVIEIKNSIKKFNKNIKTEVKNEIIINIPNSITLLRLVLVFVFIYMLFMKYPLFLLFVVFFIAAVTDWFDGYFARKLNQKTTIGARMDQVIDRVFTISIVFSLFIYMLINKGIYYKNILLLVLTCSREIIGTPGFLIALIRNKDPYQVRFIGKLTTFVQAFALGVIILNLKWAIYIVFPVCVIGIIAGFDYLKYSLSSE